jgi:hypothetical protein
MVIILLVLASLFVAANKLDKNKDIKDLELDEDGKVIVAYREIPAHGAFNTIYVKKTQIASDDWEVTRPLVRSLPVFKTWSDKP